MSRLVLVIAVLIGLSVPGRAQSDAGYEAFGEGDYITAHRIWKTLADKGKHSAQYNLGMLYHHGLGVKRQLSEAAKWYLRAAEGGMPAAQEAIGDFYASGLFFRSIDYARAAKWYRKAARQGRASAQLKIGVLLAEGFAKSPNKDAAIKWLRKAQKQGNSEAKKWLLTLKNRTGPQANPAVDAKANLKDGVMAYIRGDYAAALHKFEPLAEEGMPKAQHWLDLMEYNGLSGVPVPPETSAACASHFISQSRQYEIDAECKDVTSEACVNFLVGQNRGYDIGTVCRDIRSDACIRFLILRDRGYDIGSVCKGITSDACVNYLISRRRGYLIGPECKDVTSDECIKYLEANDRGYNIGSQCKDVDSDTCVKYLISKKRGYDIGPVCRNISSDVCVEYLISRNKGFDIETDCINISSDDCVNLLISRDSWEKIQTFCAFDKIVSSKDGRISKVVLVIMLARVSL